MKYGCIKSKLDGTENVFEKSREVPKVFRYACNPILNLGNEPICTACASDAFLNWLYGKEFDLLKIFKNSKPTKDGAELKNVFEYLLSEKLIDNFAIIKSELVLKTAIIVNGPCIAGLPVYNEDSEFWNGTNYLGGHAIAIIGWTDKGFIIRNSWGSNWGDNGYTILPYSDFNKFSEIWTLIK